jgi:aryl-alcohol dehydrogenase-like predicted oxidoreductase
MQTRRLGRTGHLSTIAIFGAAAFWEIDQESADQTMQLVREHGINHIDVAPSYGQAEERVGPWLKRERERFFVGCKTTERTKAGAAAELRRSLERLQTDHFDLYQIHAVTSMSELDEATRSGGALDAIREARQAGLTRYIGITGHGVDSPAIFLEALQRFDFDSVLFPLNFVQYANPAYRRNAEELLRQCRTKDVGVMVIKSIAKGPWGEQAKTHTTWYQPLDGAEHIQPAVNFALSQDVTGICTAGDTHVLPLVLEACEHFTQMKDQEQELLVASAGQYEPLFT